MAEDARPAVGAPGLVRRLGALDSALLVVGGVVGSGIFMTTGIMARDLPSPGLILLAWAAGGVFTLFGALTFAELGAMFPNAGGQYVYIREAFGAGAAYFFGWAFFWFIMCGGIAALAVGFSEFAGYFVPAVSPRAALFSLRLPGFTYTLSAGQVLAAACVVGLTAVNARGLKTGAVVQNALTVIRVGAVVALVAFGLAAERTAGPGALAASGLFPPLAGGWSGALKAFALALIAVFWTYDGWYSVNCAAEEVRDPARNIPRGLIAGTATVMALYVLVNVVYLRVLPLGDMAGVVGVGELAAARLFGSSGGAIMAGLIAFSVFGCLHATILYGPRVSYAMARDGLFFKALAPVHPRFRVPSRALWAQSAWSVVLCLSGTYATLFEYVIFAVLLFFVATGAAVPVLRRRRPDLPRPYRAWGYPVVPILFVLASAAIFLNTVVARPGKSLIGFAVLAAGIPGYFRWKRGAGGPLAETPPHAPN